MNVIKKYWDSVYIYVLLSVPGFCMCAGLFWIVCKCAGLYPNLQWRQIITFDFSQLVYLVIALYFIYQNKKDSGYIPEHLAYVKGFIVLALFVQYNFILYLFASVYMWECTFLFFTIIVFLFDSKLMFINIVSYAISLLAAHLIRPDVFLPLAEKNVGEIVAFRIVIFSLTAFCIMLIVHFVERFLMQAKEHREENIYLMEKQLEYYRDMELMDTELRKFRHDIKNHFICMESLLQKNDMEELQNYFQDLQQSFSVHQKIFFSGNDIIDAILHHELPYYCKKSVKVTLYGKLPKIRTVAAIDLCTIFSNMLSNAITSANRCEVGAQSQIIIQFSGGKSYFSISISNSILTQEGVIAKKRKDRNHGLGTYKIRDVLDKYDGRFEQSMELQSLTTTIYLPI